MAKEHTSKFRKFLDSKNITLSPKVYFIDAMSNMDDETLAAGKKVERV